MYSRLASTTTSRVDLLIRKTVAPVVALALCLAAFVLATSAARAAEQPSRMDQQGTVESVTIINGTVAEPVPDGTTTPVDTAPVKTAPVKTTLSVPPPVDSNPGPASEPTPVPAPERTPDPAPSPDPEPAPQSITLQADVRATEPAPSTDAAPAAAPNAGGAPPPAHEPSVPEIVPEPDTSRGNGPLPAPTTAPLEKAPATAGDTPIATPIVTPIVTSAPPASTVAQEVWEPSRTVVVPVPSGVKSYLPSGIGEATARAVASVTSAAADALGSLTGALAEPSTAGTQEEEPLEGTPQPAPPLAPPAGGGSFSPATGSGGQLAGWGFAPLLVGILALFAAILMRRDFRSYLISCEVPKPSSALLGPLERPG